MTTETGLSIVPCTLEDLSTFDYSQEYFDQYAKGFYFCLDGEALESQKFIGGMGA